MNIYFYTHTHTHIFSSFGGLQQGLHYLLNVLKEMLVAMTFSYKRLKVIDDLNYER